MIKAIVVTNEGKQVNLDLDIFTFSGGESHVKIKNVRDITGVISAFSVYSYIVSPEALISTLLLVDAVKRLPSFIQGSTRMILELPYIPGARQDRACEEGEPMSAGVYAAMINSAAFDKVLVSDPHSDVSPALINNVVVRPQHEIVQEMLGEYIKENEIVLVSPDAGAQKKVLKLSQALGGVEIIKADKVRDTKDGKILSTEVYGDVSGKKVLIVDDILDYGGTFKPLAEKLREKGAVQVDLYITHGIFGAGVDTFSGLIDNIYAKYVWGHNVEGRNEKGILKDAPSNT